MTVLEAKLNNHLHIADMTASVGALVLGIGLGALIGGTLGDLAVVVFFVGVALHAWGMWDKHHVETRIDRSEPRLARALFWLCWMLLVGVLAWFGVTSLT